MMLPPRFILLQCGIVPASDRKMNMVWKQAVFAIFRLVAHGHTANEGKPQMRAPVASLLGKLEYIPSVCAIKPGFGGLYDL